MEITALRIGTTLHFGQYKLLKVLGQGGFGITYLAHDNALDKDVAIKEFFPSMLCKRDESNNQITFATESSREMLETLKSKFIKEARNIASLNHPNIVHIYTAFAENNTAYYVMEYIRGESLSEMVKSHGAMPYDMAKYYIDQIGSALDYMHANGMTHFDVKPANIMVRNRDNCPILIDFGLSKNYDSNGVQTTTTGPLGISPGFSPVEHYKLNNTKTFSPQSDLYSLSATFFYLLTATVPPEALDNKPETLHFPPTVPGSARNAIIKGMALHADNRHTSVREFLAQLNGQSVAADSEKTVINNKAERTVINDNSGFTEPGVINHPRYSGPPSAPKTKDNSNLTFGYVAMGIAVAVAILILILRISKSGNEAKETEFITDVAKSDSLPTATLDQSVVNEESMPSTLTENETTPQPDPQITSPYGPFDSKNEASNFLQGYYEATRLGRDFSSYLAENITTNFGKEKHFNKYDYIANHRKHNEKSGYIDSNFDYNWGSLNLTPLSDGGATATYNFIYTRRDYTDDGAIRTRRYRCNLEAKINARRQIYYIKEKATNLSDDTDYGY